MRIEQLGGLGQVEQGINFANPLTVLIPIDNSRGADYVLVKPTHIILADGKGNGRDGDRIGAIETAVFIGIDEPEFKPKAAYIGFKRRSDGSMYVQASGGGYALGIYRNGNEFEMRVLCVSTDSIELKGPLKQMIEIDQSHLVMGILSSDGGTNLLCDPILWGNAIERDYEQLKHYDDTVLLSPFVPLDTKTTILHLLFKPILEMIQKSGNIEAFLNEFESRLEIYKDFNTKRKSNTNNSGLADDATVVFVPMIQS